MAVKKKVVEIDTKKAQQQVDQLKESMADLNQENKAATTSVRELRKELKAQKDIMLSTEEGTKEYTDALQKAAIIQHTLREQMEEVNASAMDFGQITGNVVKATGGIVASFQAAQAAMNLFGIENEDVIKSLEKMQNLMAITQAIPAIDDSIKAFKRLSLAIKTATVGVSKLKIALISTGIGAAVAAVGLLAANWDKVKNALGGVNKEYDKQQDLAKKIEQANESLARQVALGKQVVGILGGNDLEVAIYIQKTYADEISKTEERIRELKAANDAYNTTLEDNTEQVKSQEDILNELSQVQSLQTDGIQQSIELTSTYTREVVDNTAEITMLENEVQKYREELEKANQAVKDAQELEQARKLKELADAYTKLVAEIGNYNKSQSEIELEKLNKEEQERIALIQKVEKDSVLAEKRIQDVKDYYAKERAKIELKIQLDSLKLLEDNYKLQDAALKAQLDRQEIDIVQFNERKKELDDTYKDDYVTMLEDLLKDETLNTEQRLALYQKLNAFRNPSTKDTSTGVSVTTTDDETKTLSQQISEAINESSLALSDFSDNAAWGNILKNVATLTANWDTLHANIEKGGKEAFTAYAQIAATALSAVAQMMNGLAAEQDTSNKEGFESAKKYQVAGATMSMLAGIASAWASSMQLAFPANVIIGSVLSAMMLGTGIAQIAKIKSTQFENPGSTGASATPNASAISSIQAPVQYTQDVQGANIEGAIKDTRVYVTESDISNTQKKVSVAESENIY